MSDDVIPVSLSPPPGLISYSGRFIGRQELRALPTPPGTSTHRPIPHAEVIEALVETLGFRRLEVVRDAYAVTPDGNRMFGVLEVGLEESGVRFSVGVRNSHDKSMALGITVGYRVLCCENMCFHGDFSPILRRHTRGVEVRDVVALGIEQCQRSFPAMTRSIDAWQQFSLTDDQARVLLYRVFIERDGIVLPRHLGPLVHEAYFDPQHEEFRPRTVWSVQNAVTQAIKSLDPVPQVQAATQIGPFFARLIS